MCGTLITEHPRQQIHNSNNLNLTCISEAGGKWWRGFVSTGQIMSSQPDVDRWRQRLTLPPALCYTHTHLAAIFSQDNYLATSASPHSHTHTHTLGQLRTHTRSDNSHSRAIHTHRNLSWCVHTHSTSPPAPQNMATSSVYEGHSTQLQLPNTEDRLRPSPTYLAGIFIFFLNPVPEVMSNSHPLSVLLIPLSLIIFS